MANKVDLHMHGVPIELRERLGSWLYFFQNHVAYGMDVHAPTTASEHADAGTYHFHVNVGAGSFVLGNHLHDEPEVADLGVSGVTSPIDATHVDITYTIVAWEAEDTHVIDYKLVAGTASETGTSVAPTATAIQSAVGAGHKWIRLGTTVVTRTGAATCSQVYANEVKPKIT
jgi:hypothetical protein